MDSKIYVIMPVYNCEKYIVQAALSVLNQPYKSINVVIINDGSTDNSLSIIRKQFSSNERVTILQQENRGVSAARNTGIEYVLQTSTNDNDYIAFCDADDVWAKNCISAQLVDAFEHDLICFNICRATHDLKRISNLASNSTSKISHGGEHSLFSYSEGFSSFMYRLKLFYDTKIRFESSIKYNEDKMFLKQLIFCASSVLQISNMLYLYRSNPHSAMNTRPRGVKYYLPLIEGWLITENSAKKFQNDSRGTFRIGSVLASIYILDMAKEHYWYGGKRKELENTIKNHPHYKEFLALKSYDVSKKQYKEFLLLNNHPSMFAAKHRIIGLFVRAYHIISKTAFVGKILNNIQFKYENIYI